MKKLLIFLFAFVCVILESTLFVRLRIGGIIPNLTLIVVVSIALAEGNGWGRGIGFFMGLTHDVLFSHRIGYFALMYYLLGHLCGYGHRILRRGNLLIPLLLTILADFVYGFTNYFFLAFLHGRTDPSLYFHQIILPEAAYTSLFILPIYAFITWAAGLLSRIHVKDVITHRFHGGERIEP